MYVAHTMYLLIFERVRKRISKRYKGVTIIGLTYLFAVEYLSNSMVFVKIPAITELVNTRGERCTAAEMAKLVNMGFIDRERKNGYFSENKYSLNGHGKEVLKEFTRLMSIEMHDFFETKPMYDVGFTSSWNKKFDLKFLSERMKKKLNEQG